MSLVKITSFWSSVNPHTVLLVILLKEKKKNGYIDVNGRKTM